MRHWRRSQAPHSDHPRSIKPTPSSASTSSTACVHSRPSASSYWARFRHHAMARAPASSRSTRIFLHRPSFSSLVSAFGSPHPSELYAPLGSRSIGRRRPDAGEQRHRAPPYAIPTARDLLRRRDLAQHVRLVETKL